MVQNKKINKIIDEQENNNLRTPPSIRGTSCEVRKTKFSVNTGGLYQDNSEYCSYVTATSNSTKKIREYSGDGRSIVPKASSYIRHFHTSDGARNRNSNNSSSLDPYRNPPPYIQHSESSDFLGTWKPFQNKADRSTINSEIGPRLHEEEHSPFFIKRLIRSSNPHSRVKRKAHPMISKQFFKKQMSRHGARNKPPTSREDESIVQNSASKSENRHVSDKEYSLFQRFNYNNSFTDNWYIVDSLKPMKFKYEQFNL